VLAPNKNPSALADKNTELAVRLKVAEEQNRLLREENERLKQIELAHAQLKSEHQQTVERKVLLEEEVRWLKAQYYGRSTQRSDAAEQNVDQQLLFNEAEVLAAIEAADEAQRQRTTTIDAHERKRSADAHRLPIPEHFPRIEIVHDLAPDEKLCTRCAVSHPLTRIGEEIRECYRFEPPKIRVEQHIRPTYVCEERHEGPVTAPAPPVILPKSMASPSLLAHVIKSKFDLGLPIYRVSQDLKRYQMNVGPGTLGTWVNTVGGEKVVPLINLMGDPTVTFGSKNELTRNLAHFPRKRGLRVRQRHHLIKLRLPGSITIRNAGDVGTGVSHLQELALAAPQPRGVGHRRLCFGVAHRQSRIGRRQAGVGAYHLFNRATCLGTVEARSD
jgi:transposase